MMEYAEKGEVPVQIGLEDRLFDADNAEENIAQAY